MYTEDEHTQNIKTLIFLSIVCEQNSCVGSLTASGKCSSCGAGSQADLKLKTEEILRLEKRLEQLRLVFSDSIHHQFVISKLQLSRSSLDSNNKNEKNLRDFEETKEVWGRQVCN